MADILEYVSQFININLFSFGYAENCGVTEHYGLFEGYMYDETNQANTHAVLKRFEDSYIQPLNCKLYLLFEAKNAYRLLAQP